jgi:predicted proteasome-type protease
LKEVNRLYEKCFILDHKTREIKGRKEYNLSASDMYFIASDITSLQQEGDPRVAQIREFFTQIPDGVIFEKDVSFFRCQHLKKIGK